MTNKELALDHLEVIRNIYVNEMLDIDKYIYWINCCEDIENETVELLQKARFQRSEDICPTPEEDQVDLYDVCRKEWDKLND